MEASMQNKRWYLAVMVLVLVATLPGSAQTTREARTRSGAGLSEGDLEAKRLLDRAQDLLLAQEADRGVKMLETVIEQYPKSRIRFQAYLVLGKHYIAVRDQPRAINYLTNLRALDQPDEELSSADRELYLEGLYLIGVAYFQTRQFGQAFPILRKITTDFPNSVWANQAYYYIGLCHFAQANWGKAIEALSMVGTFVDPDSPTVQYVEAGRRFYVKVTDADLPVLVGAGQKVSVTLSTVRGDRETVDCAPLGGAGAVFISSMPTAVAPPKPGDNTLQVVGGDVITVRYVDANDQSGARSIPRESKVKVVSTGAITFTLGDFETQAHAAFLDQPLFVLLQDVDLDVSDAADTATVTVVARHKDDGDEAESVAVKGVDLQKLLQTEEQKYKIRDQVTLKLTELGAAPVHTGQFGGSLRIEVAQSDANPNQTDDVLSCALTDEIIVIYADELHIEGETPREVQAKLRVSGEIDNRPRASQDVVFDPIIRSRKNLVEGTAFLELGRIFKSMGLIKGAKEKTIEGLERVDFIIRSRAPIPTDLRQAAFKLKWELHLVADDYGSAMATCNLFNRLYPDSPFADQALMGIAMVRMENKEYTEAITVFNQILALPKSTVKAEAQFRIAEAVERSNSRRDAAIPYYKQVAERFPNSSFAGAALAKLVDYHVETKDYAQANDLLEQIFQDYPDATFLDAMLLKWVLVAYRSGDLPKAHDKCAKLLFEYPESSFAEKAKQIMPQIEARLKKGATN